MTQAENSQLIFDILLAEAMNEKALTPASDKNAERATKPQDKSPLTDKTPTPEEQKAKKLHKIKERYTAYCIEWILGLHFRTRVFSKFVPHADKILPLYQTPVRGKNHTFFSALVSSADYAGAEMFLNFPPVKKILQSEQKDQLLNLELIKSDLKDAFLAEEKSLHQTGFKNQEFKSFLQEMKKTVPLPELLNYVLFNNEKNAPIDIHQKARFSKNGPHQTALSFLISNGLMLEALDYLYALPQGTTIGDVCNLIGDKKAQTKLSALMHKKIYKGSEEAVFFATLEKSLPTWAFLKIIMQKEAHQPYKELEFTPRQDRIGAYLSRG